MDSLYFGSVVTDAVAILPRIEHLPGLFARAAFTFNSQSVFKEDVDFSCQRVQSASSLAALPSVAENGRSHIVLTIIDDSLSYMPKFAMAPACGMIHA